MSWSLLNRQMSRVGELLAAAVGVITGRRAYSRSTTGEPATGHNKLHFALVATVRTVNAGRNLTNGGRCTLRYHVDHKRAGQCSCFWL